MEEKKTSSMESTPIRRGARSPRPMLGILHGVGSTEILAQTEWNPVTLRRISHSRSLMSRPVFAQADSPFPWDESGVSLMDNVRTHGGTQGFHGGKRRPAAPRALASAPLVVLELLLVLYPTLRTNPTNQAFARIAASKN